MKIVIEVIGTKSPYLTSCTTNNNEGNTWLPVTEIKS
jgi:hypothetical protein